MPREEKGKRGREEILKQAYQRGFRAKVFKRKCSGGHTIFLTLENRESSRRPADMWRSVLR